MAPWSLKRSGQTIFSMPKAVVWRSFVLNHLGGLVVGARQGIIYIRHEYVAQEHILEDEIRRCYAEGLLGSRILASDLSFDLEVFVSPGGYICGEESALLEAIEGKRAEPRNKPPFPGQQGLWQKPTVINNVETFFFVPVILARGVEWLKAQGKNGSVGMKFVGVSGDVQRAGVFEVPMGTTYRELIEQYAGGAPAGRTIKAFAPSGPAGGYLPASMLDLPLDWTAMTKAGATVGSGAIVVCDDRACMLDMALNAVRFFRNESCGKCVPCRVGSAKMVDVLTDIAHGRGRPEHLAMIDDLSHALVQTSICGLGQAAPNGTGGSRLTCGQGCPPGHGGSQAGPAATPRLWVCWPRAAVAVGCVGKARRSNHARR